MSSTIFQESIIILLQTKSKSNSVTKNGREQNSIESINEYSMV